jgi:hypothetical protein
LLTKKKLAPQNRITVPAVVMYIGEPVTEDWITCDKCSEWWHKVCVSIKELVIISVITASVHTLTHQGEQEYASSKFFCSPTDAQVNCLKNNFKIYIKIELM